MQKTDFIWMNGDMVEWDKATVHVLTHGLHYGTSFFEGIRVYDTHKGPCGFRLAEHVRRLKKSAEIYHVEIPYSADDLIDACHAVITENKLSSAYIRPVAYIAYGKIGVCPAEFNVDVSIAAFPWGTYLGEGALENGVDACVSSWNRVAPNTIPSAAKAGGNYLSSFLISHEAHANGFHEGIALNAYGFLSEGAGENLFLIKDGKIFTPPSANSILTGITRDSVIKIARDLGYSVEEQSMVREFLYTADEIFMTGTAAEITPVRSVDRIKIGDGMRGPITEKIQSSFFGIFNGEYDDKYGWLEPIKNK